MYPPTPSMTYMRSEPLVIHLEIVKTSILSLTLICICMVYILSHIDLNCRFVTFDTRLNTLKVSEERRLYNLDFCLLVLSYLLIFDYHFVVFLPPNLIKIDLDIQRITKVVILFKIFHMKVLSTTSCSCVHLIQINMSCMYHFPFETIAMWICLMHLVLCPDIHPNPGPAHSNNFTGGSVIL